ncbi:MAG TPA: DUF371 domain-containing protein [Nitrososphaerales archaeon]|nr:DUF371 domain-containing protein [Nitrososphaerales archaeon]
MSRLIPVAGSQVLRETVTFRGHPMVRALHPTTIEVTTDEELTPRGDCIIGVGADKGCEQLGNAVKAAIRRKEARVRIGIMVGDFGLVVNARGDPGLELSNRHEMVVRRSSFLSDRTLALHADLAARDIPRAMIRLLTNPETVGRLEIEVG